MKRNMMSSCVAVSVVLVLVAGVYGQSILSASDFEHHVQVGWSKQAHLFWTLDGEVAHFGMEAPNSRGYLALGFNPQDSGHLDLDVVVGWMGGGGQVRDFWSKDYDDVDLDGSQDVINGSISTSGGQMAMTFSRSTAVPEDRKDGAVPLVDADGFTKLIWAYDDEAPEQEDGEPDVEQHDRWRRGSVLANMNTGTATAIPEGIWGPKNPVVAHGFFMLLGWFAFLATGAVASCLPKLHARLSAVGTSLVFIGLGLATGIGGPRLRFLSLHGLLGLALVLSLLLVTTTAARVSAYRHVQASATGARRVHVLLGVVLLVGAVGNAFLGLSSAGLGSDHWLFVATLGGAAVVALGLVCAGVAFVGKSKIQPELVRRDSFAARTEAKIAGSMSNKL